MSLDGASHPPEDALRQWTRDELSEADAATIEAHLERCDRCAAALERLIDVNDPFAATLRRLGADAGVVVEPPVPEFPDRSLRDGNLRFGVLAVQLGVMTREQFVDAAMLWSTYRNKSFAEVAVERLYLSPAAAQNLEAMLASKADGLDAAAQPTPALGAAKPIVRGPELGQRAETISGAPAGTVVTT
ncbi:MAG: zf-HC2 domain-containing protein, partial [Planctomycetales bacterium]|nr:zf-HC2 domain-containing protein [Planctomycetales bacterium]